MDDDAFGLGRNWVIKSLDKIIKMIQEELANGQVKQIGWIEMIRRLEKRGIERIDIDYALDEAETLKIIDISDGFCKWIDPSMREMEKAKTHRYFNILAEIFKDGEIGFLPRQDLKVALRERGLNDDEITRAIAEAGRDRILDFHSRIFGSNRKLVAGYSFILPEDRERFLRAERADKEFSNKWYEKKVSQNDC